MLHFEKWKIVGIIATVVLAILVASPNILPKSVQDSLRAYNLNPVTLGLDLQGGINILLEIDREDLKARSSEQMTGDIRAALREAKIGYNGINRFDNGVRVRITKPEDVERATAELKKLAQPVDTGGLFGATAPASLFDMSVQDRLLNGQPFVLGTSYRFNPGDTVTATLYHTDLAYFRFRQSVRDARQANGNPFAQPSAIFSNVQGGVGIFTVLSGTRATKVVK